MESISNVVYIFLVFLDWLSCHAFKLGIGSEQDARTTRLSPLLTLRFKCRTAYSKLLSSPAP